MQPMKTQLKPPLPTPPQSRKRLLVDSTPNFTSPSPQSSLSSDSSSEMLAKKTRDMPNLYDCHSCNRHVNFANQADRLRILESAWRVVLLCKECIRSVELGKVCSYCLRIVEGSSCFKCVECERLVHRECVEKYSVCPPWSYCPVSERFRVCVDCWLPRSVRWKKTLGGCEALEDCVREAECVAGKKLEMSVKAKEDAMRKRDAARKAVDYASGVLRRDGLEDGELALQLHRAMNSSPRISRSFGPVNYSCLGGGRRRKLGFFGKIKVRGDRPLNEIVEAKTGLENGKGCGDVGLVEGVVREFDRGVDNGTDSGVKHYERRNKQKSSRIVDKNLKTELVCYQRQKGNKLKRVLGSDVKSTQIGRGRVRFYYSRRKHDHFMPKNMKNLSSKGDLLAQKRNLYDILRSQESLWRQEYVLALPTPSKCPTN